MPVATSETRPKKSVNLANIPAFPAVVLRVLDIVSQDEPDLRNLVQEINSDATLSAQVLRLANSPLFGFSAQIGTVQHAVVALGTEQIQSLVMSVATANYSRAAFRSEALRKCWRHTLASAVLSREVARAAGMAPEKAYSLGLLHDIGRLGLLVAWPEDYSRILEEANRDGVSLLEMERQLFNMDHCEVGQLLVEQWKLPADFRTVAGHHHDPPTESGKPDFLRVAYLGCQMADSLGYWAARPLQPVPIEELLALLPAEVRERFPADPEVLTELVERSVSDGSDALSEPAQEFSTGRRKTPQSDETAGDSTEGTAPVITTPVTVESEMFKAPEARPLAWDFMIVLASVVSFLCVFVALWYFSSN
jgi:HD-like signal output (HDOD) protein